MSSISVSSSGSLSVLCVDITLYFLCALLPFLIKTPSECRTDRLIKY